MDYLELVLQGYFNPNTNKYLLNYFFRECKKAESEHYTYDEFFKGCLDAVERIIGKLQSQICERKRELDLMLRGAQAGMLNYDSLDGKTIEQKHKETIEWCKAELANERPNGIGSLSFTAHLFNLYPNNDMIPIAYPMAYNEIIEIQKAIYNARDKYCLNLVEKITNEKSEIGSASPSKSFHKYLDHKNSEALAEGIKKEFDSKTFHAKEISSIIYALKTQGLLKTTDLNKDDIRRKHLADIVLLFLGHKSTKTRQDSVGRLLDYSFDYAKESKEKHQKAIDSVQTRVREVVSKYD